MVSTNLINSLLDGIHKLQDKGDFVDDSDLTFLKEYFENSRMIFSVMDNLESYKGDSNLDISGPLFDDVTNSVRKVSKKNRDAARLLHILKKPNFKAFFNTLEQLSNQTYIEEPYTGELHEIDISINPVLQYSDERDSQSGSGTASDYSEESEEISEDTRNLPSYQDVQYEIPGNEDINEDFQIVQFQRDPQKPLGITVTKHEFIYDNTHVIRCMVERVLVNSMIDKQDVLHVGDIIFEVNKRPVETPEELQYALSEYSGLVSFKIIKSLKRPMSNVVNMEKSYVRALFDYDPMADKLIPNESIGLAFKCGDVFEIVNRDDPNFWQASPLNSTSSQALLVPSQALQERRIALEGDMKMKPNDNHGFGKWRRKSKTNELFRAQNSADIIRDADLRTYEEVVKFPPSRVPCLLLLGAPGIGKKAIKHILVQKEPNRFAFPIQDTTEPKRGRTQPLFNHIDKNVMLNDIKSSLYVCVEEKAGELYGIKSSTIRDLINQNKTVVLDCRPMDVYSMRLPIFNPYVVFVSAPTLAVLESMQKDGLSRNLTKNKRSTAELQDIVEQSERLQSEYGHLVNCTVVNESPLKSAHTISQRVNDAEGRESWVPAGWENDMIPLPVISFSVARDTGRDSVKSPDGLGNGAVQGTLTRRFEKKGEKTTTSLLPASVAISNVKGTTVADDDSESSQSDGEMVRARPVVPLTTSKPVVKKDSVVKAVAKPKEPTVAARISLKRDTVVNDKEVVVKEKETNLRQSVKLPDKEVKVTVVKDKDNVKQKGKSQEEKLVVVVAKDKEPVVRGKERDSVKPRVKSQEKEEVVKVKEPVAKDKEAVAKVSVRAPQVGGGRPNEGKGVPVARGKPAPLRMATGSSSSEVSDTSSEEDQPRGLKENRV